MTNAQGNRGWAAVMVAATFVLLAAAIRAPAQTYSVLYDFKGGIDGAFPDAGVIADSAGNLYGTAEGGGAYGYGAVYEIPTTGGETVLYSFAGGMDGGNPHGSLIRDEKGNLYGTTFFGGNTGSACEYGSSGCGVVFVVSPAGHERVLYAFTGGSDGSNPYSGLIHDSAGNLYGTTFNGGDVNECTGAVGAGCGVVFTLESTGTETVLHSFTGNADGENPWAGLVRDASGNVYGTTAYGGTGTLCGSGIGCGVVFEIDSSGSETVLSAFTGGTDGSFPNLGALVADASDNLYGTTFWGGDLSCGFAFGCGVVYKISSGSESVVHAFTNGTDGGDPGGLVRDAQGNLYAATAGGGSLGHGVVFKMTAAGSESVLHSFDGTNGGDGGGALYPYGGYLYGTTADGGSDDAGVVFKVKP